MEHQRVFEDPVIVPGLCFLGRVRVQCSLNN